MQEIISIMPAAHQATPVGSLDVCVMHLARNTVSFIAIQYV